MSKQPAAEPFRAVTRLEALGEGAFEARISEGWYQGRGAFGGLIVALIVRAIEALVGDDGRHLRTLTCHFCAPAVAGALRIEVEVARSSSSVTHLSARVTQAGGVVAIATATRARAREIGLSYDDRRPPTAAPPEEIAPLDLSAFGPPFTRELEHRFAFGTPPFSKSSSAHFGGWVRHREAGPLDAALAAAYADAWPPAFFARVDRPRDAATVAITYYFFTDFPPEIEAEAGDSLLVTVRSDVLLGGYAGQEHEVWTRAGTLVALVTQLMAIVR